MQISKKGRKKYRNEPSNIKKKKRSKNTNIVMNVDTTRKESRMSALLTWTQLAQVGSDLDYGLLLRMLANRRVGARTADRNRRLGSDVKKRVV